MEKEIEKLFGEAAELSASELEKPNFEAAVIQALKNQEQEVLIEMIKTGKISLEQYANKMVEMGKLAEKAAEKAGNKFDSTEHLNNRAEMAATELIEQSREAA